MTLDAAEFLRRFLLHVLPNGFVPSGTTGYAPRATSTPSLRLQAACSTPAPRPLRHRTPTRSPPSRRRGGSRFEADRHRRHGLSVVQGGPHASAALPLAARNRHARRAHRRFEAGHLRAASARRFGICNDSSNASAGTGVLAARIAVRERARDRPLLRADHPFRFYLPRRRPSPPLYFYYLGPPEIPINERSAGGFRSTGKLRACASRRSQPAMS